MRQITQKQLFPKKNKYNEQGCWTAEGYKGMNTWTKRGEWAVEAENMGGHNLRGQRHDS